MILLGIPNGMAVLITAPVSYTHLLCEEMGLVMGVIVVVAIAMLILFARNDATRSRSTFYSISACAAAGLLLFQTCLNVFGATRCV